MKRYVLLALAAALTAALFAQVADNPIDNELNMRQLVELTPFSPGARVFDRSYEGVKGSPYLEDAWLDGKLKIFGGKLVEDLKLNINLQTQLVLVNLKTGGVGHVPIDKMEYVVVESAEGPRTFRRLGASLVEGVASPELRLYEVLHDGEFILLKRHDKKFRKANYRGAYTIGEKHDEYYTEFRYFMRPPDGGYQRLRLKPKAIEKALSSHAADIRAIAQEQGLTLDNEASLLELTRRLEDKRAGS
jgi:hypothetical protein